MVSSAALLLSAGCDSDDDVANIGDNDDSNNQPTTPVYLNPDYSFAERGAALTAELTPEERVSQMISSRAAAIPRLRIPAYSWWNEAVHGVAREGLQDNANPDILINTTSYPVSLSLGSTWNPDLMYREASMIGNEMREVVRNNKLDLNIYSPTVNLGRDPRWGRNDETFSEDPLLTAVMGAAYVNGIEGKNRNGELSEASGGYLKTSATIKHFAANNSEFNRLDGSSNISEAELRDYYTAQFHGIIDRAQPSSIMSSYNEVNGVPAPADVKLIDKLARKTYGFKGFFTSDCDAIYIIQAGHHWQPDGYDHPLDKFERAAFANAAGEDLECQQGYHDDYNYANSLLPAIDKSIKTGVDTFNQNDIDVSVARLMTVRMALGEFDPISEVPWIGQARDALNGKVWINSNANNAITETPERLAMARKVATQSLVLLKNEPVGSSGRTLLPLQVPKSGAYSLAVIGPFANPDEMFLGGYSSIQKSAGEANEINGCNGLRAAVKAINGNATVDCYPGVTGDDFNTVDSASVAAASTHDAVVLYVGTSDKTAAEAADRPNLALPGAQPDLIQQVAARNPNTVVYIESIGPVNVSTIRDEVPALVWSSYNGMRKGAALADVLLGDVNPSGHLPFTWYRDESQLPPIGDYTLAPHDNEPGRTYQYFEGEPSYPFGYGLSYTQFEYSNVAAQRVDNDGIPTIRVTGTVKNTGSRDGADVVQVYAVPPNAGTGNIAQQRLVGFQRVAIGAGDTADVRIDFPVDRLARYDADEGHETVATGTYTLRFASSSSMNAAHQQQATVNISSTPEPRLEHVTVQLQAAGDAANNDVVRRLIFAPDTVVAPKVTLAMSNQALYGYIEPGQSKPLPDGATVSYSSNRGDVLATDGDSVRTVGTGVATLTTTVKYGAQKVSDKSVVVVK
ncbi:glycoside hydrolase family 3 C-terminal domain-containing protein [Salinisphaera sp.]|uniref:glycoside hydrolase family 3 C-terminal domain-containing protein n=1 Tax=Salinisphaera sp. TaxID=1914330 RepID=UPI002D7A2C85|nr:glycoside hydrolase family 3 C-terminal domain-containing protein [Salinisphaera sp.]HET7314662.1 glycoside hydrolase family 3 C-terminal domain-containing protein [Salinisphaera sp.]